MATVLEDAATFAQDTTLTGPMTAAVVSQGLVVMAEDPTVAGHGQRASLAIQVLTVPSDFAKRFAWACSTNAELVAAWISGDKATALDTLDDVVAGVWDAVAGITQY